MAAAAGADSHRRNGRLSVQDDSSQEDSKSLKEELRLAQVAVREHVAAEVTARNEIDLLTKMLQKKQKELESRCQEQNQKVTSDALLRTEMEATIREEVALELRKEYEATIRKEVALELRKEYDAHFQREVMQMKTELEGQFGNVLAAKTSEIEDQCRKELDRRTLQVISQHQHQLEGLQALHDRVLSEKAELERAAKQEIGGLRVQICNLQDRVMELQSQNVGLTQRLLSQESMPSQTHMFPIAVMQQLERRRREIAMPPADRPDRYGHVREPKLLSAWIAELESILTQQGTKWRYANAVDIRSMAYRTLTHEFSTLSEAWDPMLQLDMASLQRAIVGSGIGRTVEITLSVQWKNQEEARELLDPLKELLRRVQDLNWMPKKPTPRYQPTAPLGLLPPRRPPPSAVPRLHPPPAGISMSPVVQAPSPTPPIPAAQLQAPLSGQQQESQKVSEAPTAPSAQLRAPLSGQPQESRKEPEVGEVEQPVSTDPPPHPQEAPPSQSRKRLLADLGDLPDPKRRPQR